MTNGRDRNRRHGSGYRSGGCSCGSTRGGGCSGGTGTCTGTSTGGGCHGCVEHAGVVGDCGLEVRPVDPHQGSSRDGDSGGVDVLDVGGREVPKYPCSDTMR